MKRFLNCSECQDQARVSGNENKKISGIYGSTTGVTSQPGRFILRTVGLSVI